MTNEAAIRYCDEYLARNISDIDKEFLKKAKEALQQEPCDKCVYSTREGCQYDDITEAIPPFKTSDDAISRQAVLDKLNRLIEVERLQGTDEMGYGRERVRAYESMIFEIESEYLYPPATSQPKMGHWIDNKCSVCGKGIEDLIESSEWYRNEDPNFCPFCGLKLLPQAESEV